MINKVRLILCLLTCYFLTFSFAFAAGNKNSVPNFVINFLQENNIVVAKTYKNSFERLADFKDFYIVPPNYKGSSSHKLDSENVFDGTFSHKAWIYRTNKYVKGVNNNHRAYPTFPMKKTSLGIVKSMVLVDIYVWADIDLSNSANKNWFSLATYTSYDDNNWFRTYLVNVDKNYRVHLMHVPTQAISNPDIFQSKSIKMPRKKWVRITTLIDYSNKNRFNSPIIAVWQDKQLVSASRFDDRINPIGLMPSQYPKCLKVWNKKDIKSAEKLCGLKYKGGLAQMHFGLYAPTGLGSGTIYNDGLTVRKLVRK